MSVREIVEQLGGVDIVGDLRSDLALAGAIRGGFPIKTARTLIARGRATSEELHSLISDPGVPSLNERKGPMLSPAESDRLARAARVIATAEEVLGTPEKARRWLRKANRGLQGHVPLVLLRTEPGGRIVEQALHRMAHGIVA